MAFKVPNQFRRRISGFIESPLCGLFMVPSRPGKPPLKVIASDGHDAAEAGYEPWEHVSVSMPDRCPTWTEMCKVKALFWDDEDCVMQLHPPRSRWISNHPYCLHMWRPVGQDIPTPPDIMVGVQSAGELWR